MTIVNDERTSGASANGASSPEEAIAASIRRRVEAEERKHADLRADLDECAGRLRRLKRALAALIDEPVSAPSRSSVKAEQRVAPEKVELVRAAFARHGGATSITDIARELPGIGPEMVRRAVNVLRQEGQLRLVGVARGGGRNFKIVQQRPTPVDDEPVDDERAITPLSRAAS